MIIGFSGSPIKGGDIEKGLKAVLGPTGVPGELGRRAELDMKICRACKGCVETNRRAIDDDINGVLDRA